MSYKKKKRIFICVKESCVYPQQTGLVFVEWRAPWSVLEQACNLLSDAAIKGYCYDANWINFVKGWVECCAFVTCNESVNHNTGKLICGSAIKLEFHKSQSHFFQFIFQKCFFCFLSCDSLDKPHIFVVWQLKNVLLHVLKIVDVVWKKKQSPILKLFSQIHTLTPN
jgi:hypothetical protein